MKNIRLAKMEKLILERRIMSLKELQEEFGISMNTIRRDINELIENGNIKKVYGGVEYCESEVEFSDFLERCVRDKDFKELIGRKASRFVEDNDIIFVDSGTTTMNIIYYLCDKKNVTIITSNLSVVIEASRKENINLIALGGEVNRRTFSFASKDSLSILKDINITKAFMAATGISMKNGATNSTCEEKDIKSEVVNKAEKVFMLVDHTKFDKHALFTYCGFDDIDCIITDKAPDLWSDEIDQLIFKGSSVIEEVVFFHKSTKTLIVTDLIENFEPEKIASPIRRKIYRLARVTAPDGQTPIDYRMTFLGRQREAKVSFSRMLNWKPDKIILAHGLCFFKNGTDELRRAFRWIR